MPIVVERGRAIDKRPRTFPRDDRSKAHGDRHHTENMQGIRGTAERQRETQKHFGLVEEFMKLVTEQRRHALSQSRATPGPPAPMMEGEMATPPAPSSGDQAGMMMDEAMELPTAAGQGHGMGGGMMGGMHGEYGVGMGGMAGGVSMSGAADAANRIPDREALMADTTRRSQHMADLSDPDSRSS